MSTAGAGSPGTESKHRSSSSSATVTVASYISVPTLAFMGPARATTWQLVTTVPLPITTPLPIIACVRLDLSVATMRAMLGETSEKTSTAERVVVGASNASDALALEEGSGSACSVAFSITLGGGAPTDAGSGNGGLADDRSVQTIPETTSIIAHKTSHHSPLERASRTTLCLVARATAFNSDAS